MEILSKFEKFFRKESVILCLFVLIAVFLYYFYIPFPGFWFDEAVSSTLSYSNISSLTDVLLTGEAHPPFYYLAIKLWRYFWGDSENSFRFFSFLFFLPTVLLIYFFAKKIFGNDTARFSLLLSSTSHFLIFYSHQARPYEILAFLSVLSFFCFYKLIERFKITTAVVYGLATLIGLYTHYWFVLLFAVQVFLVFLLIKKTEFKKIFLTLILTGLLFLPWAIIYLLKFQQYSGTDWMGKANIALLTQSLGIFMKGQGFLILPISILGIVILIINIKSGKIAFEKKKLIFILSYFLMPLILAYIISKFLPIYTPGRRDIVALPGFIILAAYLFSQIKFKYWLLILSFFLIIFSYQAIIDSNKYMKSMRSNDALLIRELTGRLKDGDTVVLYGASGASFDYYFSRQVKEGDLKINKIYFPAELKKYPGSLNFMFGLFDDKKLVEEKLRLLGEQLAAKSQKGDIYVFINIDPMAETLADFFGAKYKLSGFLKAEEPKMPSWFSEILIYSEK